VNAANAVLLIHGFAGSPHDVRPISDALERKGVPHRAITLPGHDTSPREMKHADMDRWLDAARSGYASLAAEYERIAVVGFSMGGALSLIVASENPVCKLVMLNPYFRVRPRWYYFGQPEAWARRLEAVLGYVKKPRVGFINDRDGRRRYGAHPQYRFVPTKCVKHLVEIGRTAMAQASKVAADALWFHSTGDQVADFAHSRKAFDRIASTKKEFVTLSRSNHIVLYDFDADDIVAKAMVFLLEA
jgi:carboxylesterase